jgi:hypothetical protein
VTEQKKYTKLRVLQEILHNQARFTQETTETDGFPALFTSGRLTVQSMKAIIIFGNYWAFPAGQDPI